MAHFFVDIHSCGDTSEVLAKYLLSKGIETSYKWGMFKGRSHAWLTCGNYIIDINADQFEEISNSVIVTADDTWYSKFENNSSKIEVFKDFNNNNHARLNNLYLNILNRIKS